VKDITVTLTDKEWMDLIDGERKDGLHRDKVYFPGEQR
jgi:hypothetical protein